MKRRLFIALLLLLTFVLGIDAQKSDSKGRYSVHITLVEKGSNEAIVMGNCLLQPLGAYATTNADGKATIANVPADTLLLMARITTRNPPVAMPLKFPILSSRPQTISQRLRLSRGT